MSKQTKPAKETTVRVSAGNATAPDKSAKKCDPADPPPAKAVKGRYVDLRVVFWPVVFLLLFFFQQNHFAFHFFYIEQEQLFLWDSSYLMTRMIEPAGMVTWITEFCVQFFVHPHYGALIMSAWLTCIGMLTAGIIRRIAPAANLFLLCLLPVVLVHFNHFDANYSCRGTIAYTLLLVVMYGYFFITNLTARVLYAILFGVLLFWSAGAVSFLFATCILWRELFNRFSRAYYFIIPLLPVAMLAFWGVYSARFGEFRLLLFPDGYYNHMLRPGIAIYFPWIFLFILLLVCRLLCKREKSGGVFKHLETVGQLLLVIFVFWLGKGKFVNRDTDIYSELDFYMRSEQWDKIIERCGGDITDHLHLCCLNMALAEKGELTDRMFSFNQKGVRSLSVPWNKEPRVSVLLSDIYFSMGDIALAQWMAFEANVSMPNSCGTRMLKRLIQTNLIYGAYPVAEKYIDLLGKTKYYKDWSNEHRRFLWNDEAVENDSLLGIKRRCIPAESILTYDLQVAFIEQVAANNPDHVASLQYTGAFYLLSKQLHFFKDFIGKFYGTNVLPVLPEAYQEAIIILSEQEPSYLEQFVISPSVIVRFNEYKKQVTSNQNNSAALPGLLKKKFGNTYWYYYMYV